MNENDLAFADISEVARRLRTREITSVALTEMILKRIETHEPALNSFITVTTDAALKAAAKADQQGAEDVIHCPS